ncbi:MAG: NrsF family protein [Acetobacteraceae bacterium]
MSGTDHLIERLVAEAAPVRRLQPPMMRAAGWIALAVAVGGIMLWSHGLRRDLPIRLRDTTFLIGLGAAMLTGILAVVAALTASLPDRSRHWLWLPLPAVVLWLSTITGGCLLGWVGMSGNAVPFAAVLQCLEVLAVTTLPLSAALFWLLRPLARVMPTGAAAMASLAVAAFAAATLNLIHPFNSSALILASNFGAAALVWAVDASLARFALRRTNRAGASADEVAATS